MALLNNSGSENRFPAANNTEETTCTLDVAVTKITCNPSKVLADQIESTHTSYDSKDLARQRGILLELSYKSPCDLTGLQFKLDLEKLSLPKDCKFISAVGGRSAGVDAAVKTANFIATNSNNHILIYDNPELPNAERTQLSFLSTTMTDYGNAGGLGKYIDIYSASATFYRFWFDATPGDTAPPAGGGTLVEVAIDASTTTAEVATAFKSAVEGVTGTPFQVSYKTGSDSELVINPKTTGNLTDSSVAVIAGTALTLTKLNDGRDSQLAASTSFTPLCYVLLGTGDCEDSVCPDAIEVSDIVGAVNNELKAPPATWSGQARKGVYDITGLYYCAGLISGRNPYDVKFDTQIDKLNKITIVDLVTLSNRIRYDLGEDTIASSGVYFVPKSCCVSNPSTGCFADVEILQIKLTEPNAEGKSDMYVALGYNSSDSVSGIQLDLCYNVFVNSEDQGSTTLRDSISDKWISEVKTIRNRLGYDRTSRILAYQSPFKNSSQEVDGVPSDSSLKRYNLDTLSDANVASSMLQEYSLPPVTATAPLIIFKISGVEHLVDYTKSHFEYTYDPPIEGRNRPNFIRDYKRGDEYTGEVSFFNGSWYTGASYVPGKSIRLAKVYDYFDLLNVRIVTNSRRAALKHGEETPALDYMGKRVLYDFDPSVAPFTSISSSGNLSEYFSSVLSTFNQKALSNGLNTVASLSRYDSDIKFVSPSSADSESYNDNGYNTDANLDGVFDVADLLALSNLASFRSVVGITSPSSMTFGASDTDIATFRDRVDTRLAATIRDLSGTFRLDTSQIDICTPEYVCKNNLVTTSLPETCPDIKNSAYDGMYLYMTERVEVTSPVAPQGFRNWYHYFYEVHGLTSEKVPNLSDINMPYYYFEVWAATNTPKTKFIKEASFSLDLCNFYGTGSTSGTPNLTGSIFVQPYAGDYFNISSQDEKLSGITSHRWLQIDTHSAPDAEEYHSGYHTITSSGSFDEFSCIPTNNAWGTNGADSQKYLRIRTITESTAAPITADGGGVCLAKIFLKQDKDNVHTAWPPIGGNTILWDQGRTISFVTGTYTTPTATKNFCEIKYTDTPTSTVTREYNANPSSEDGYLAVGPNMSYTSYHYKDNSASSHTYGEFNLHLKVVNENSVDVMYATDKPFDRVQFGVKTSNNVNPSSIDTSLFMPSHAGYSSLISLTSSVNPTGYGVISIFPTGSVTMISGSGTLCRIKYDKNIFDRDKVESGKIFACPPLGGDDSSRELIIPDLYNRENLSKRGEFYSSYSNQKLSIHIKSDEVNTPLSSDTQAYVIDTDHASLALSKMSPKYIFNTLTDGSVVKLIRKVINPYEQSVPDGGYNVGIPDNTSLSAPTPPLRTPYIYDSDGYRSVGFNSSISSLTNSYVRGFSTDLAATNASREVTVFVVFDPADLSTNDYPQHIFGTDYYDGASPGADNTNSKISLRVGKGGYNGSTHLVSPAPAGYKIPTTLPGTNTEFILEFHLSGSGVGGAESLYHKFEDETQAEKRHVACFRHKYDSTAPAQVLYGDNGSAPDILGEMRIDGDVANQNATYDLSNTPWSEADPFSPGGANALLGAGVAGTYTLGNISRYDAVGPTYDGVHVNGLDFDGTISEVLVFAEALSYDDTVRVEGYLAHKWGTQDLLPNDHPFKRATSVYEILGETESLAKALEVDFDTNPRYSGLLSDRSAAAYTAEKVCIKHNTDPVTRITGGVYRTPGTYYPGYPPPPFDPNTISDLSLWVDPSDATKRVTGTGLGIASLLNKSTGGILASGKLQAPAAVNEPTVLTHNGKEWLNFDGVNDYLQFHEGGVHEGLDHLLDSGYAFDLYMVIKPEQSSTGKTAVVAYENTPIIMDSGGWWGAGIKNPKLADPTLKELQTFTYAASYGGLHFNLPLYGAANPRTLIQIGQTDPGLGLTNNVNASINGGAQSTLPNRGRIGSLTQPLSVAGAGYTALLYYQGLIGELLVFARELTPAERSDVTTYLKGKWGTP